MKLDATIIRYLTSVEWRVLIAVEMGMKNHELVPVLLITRIANLRRTGIQQILSNLLKHKLLAHDRKVYDGYKLTYLGYDFLALRALSSREAIITVGMRMGVGKESDIHICESRFNRVSVLKLHRLGRISFRSIKRNRDYLGHRQSASWMYLARLAAAKEYAYMKALYEQGFPVPEPIDLNRHAIVMEYIDAFPLSQIRTLQHPKRVLEDLMKLIVRFAEVGLIHCDFNQFNLMIDQNEKITVIDFPQIIGVHHPDAEMYFNRDVQCIRSFFLTRFGIEVTQYPILSEIHIPVKEQPLSSTISSRYDNEYERLLNEFQSYTEEEEAEKKKIESIDEFVTQMSSISDNDASNHETHSDISESHLEQMNSDQSDISDNDPDEENNKSLPSKRLDNVWTPSVKRRTKTTAKRQVTATEKKKKKKITAGNAGGKKNRDHRKASDQIKYDW